MALNTSGDARLDLFGTIGSLREADENKLPLCLLRHTHRTNSLLQRLRSMQETFVAVLERKTFRTIIRYMAEKHPEALRPNLDLVGVFGRYDDLYELIGTPLEDDMWATMKKQFEEDLQNLNAEMQFPYLQSGLRPQMQAALPQENSESLRRRN